MRLDGRFGVRIFLFVLPAALCLGCGMKASERDVAGPARGVITRPAEFRLRADDVRDAEVGKPFVFQAKTDHSAGHSLKFSARNLPPWASFDADTGSITGTPGPHDVGAYESIAIAATDSTNEVSTAPFTITVLSEVAPAERIVATVRWELPPSKNDGSPLDDLAGYRILYGRDADDLDQSVFVMNPVATSYDFAALDTGVWYFAIVAVNASGLEGPATLPAMKSI